jgi:NADH-quinone oxidoreductase subunit G
MLKIKIDGKDYEVEPGYTVIQACEIAGIEIPRFCYHEKLKIAGNCRMCLVDIEKSPKPVASCAMPVADGMVIYTNNDRVKKAREGVMEFLLINHPLDCPICDQAGECDLQDQAFKYGKGDSRFEEDKRTVKDKYMGPLIKTHMTRCIQCTRCIRFAEDVAGVPELGAVGRGEHMEITTYLEKTLDSELSANVIDLCPVGALTSKPYAFKARPWELNKTESIDITDAIGSNIRVDSRGLEVLRILPKRCDEINEEWISDKARYLVDGLKNQRLDRAYIKNTHKKFEEVSIDKAILLAADKLSSTKPSKIGAIAGNLTDLETMYLTKFMLNKMGCKNYDFNQHNYKFDLNNKDFYKFNTPFYKIDEADFILIIGANPRHNATVLNARIRKAQVERKVKIARLGSSEVDLRYKTIELGDNLKELEKIYNGNSSISSDLAAAKFPIMIIGDGIYTRDDSNEIYKQLVKIAYKHGFIKDGFNGFNTLINHASTMGAMEIDFNVINGGMSAIDMIRASSSQELDVLLLLGADDLDFESINNCCVIYIGHHGDNAAKYADIIIPGAAYTEKSATYINLEKRVQRTHKAVKPPKNAQEDWLIIKELLRQLNISIILEDIVDLRNQMRTTSKIFEKINHVIDSGFKHHIDINEQFSLNLIQIDKPIKEISVDYYFTDQICRSSKTMSDCAKAKLETILT